MNIILRLLECTTCILFLFSCNIKKEQSKDLQKFYGSYISIPSKAIIYDSLYLSYLLKKYKIVVYYNSSGCTQCKLQELSHWKIRISEIERLSATNSLNVSFAFIFSPGKEINNLIKSLNTHKLKTIILIDTTKEFEKYNYLPANENLHTFLLDSTNRVILVGQPTNNDKLWKLYKKIINS